MAEPARLAAELRSLLGPEFCLADPAALSVYARDASHLSLGRPLCVCLPADDGQAAAVVRLCARRGVPFVARGAGTGLSGGALPVDGAVVLGLARLDTMGPVDVLNRVVRVGPGAVNLRVSDHARPLGLEFAPDPSSESAATIGGNVAENAGGPHCLKVGVTQQHVRRLEWVDAAGERRVTGAGLAGERGLDLAGLLTGSEGVLGVVTAADLLLTPRPAAAGTLLALFADLDAASEAVVGLLGAGLLPAALEMIDGVMLGVVEQAFAFGFPTDAAAALIVEFTGQDEAVAEDAARAGSLLADAGARVRRAADDAEREDLWRCRKKAFGAVGRLSPAYVTMDVAVPVGRLPEMVRAVQREGERHGVAIATALHAGDGNLHPGVMYDDRDSDSERRAHAAADAIVAAALDLGGTVTGEHGVGIEKLHLLARQIDPEAARLMTAIKALADPTGLCNPGKALAAPAAAAGTSVGSEPPAAPDFAWASLTVTAPADAGFDALQRAAMARGFWVPCGAPRPGLVLGALVDHGAAGPALLGRGASRDFLLQIRARCGDGRAFRAGAPTAKDVAGLDLVRLVAGGGGVLARCEEATFVLRPHPEAVGRWTWQGGGRLAGGDFERLRALLAARDESLGAPAFWRRGGPLTVMAPGRDRDWDLGGLGAELADWADGAGLDPGEAAVLPFAAAYDEAATEAGDAEAWSRLSRLSGAAVWPDLPDGADLVWQGAPEVLWLPESAPEAPAGWSADIVMRDGRPTPLPEPASGVPLDLLRGLKRIFDPEGRLPTPSWLAGSGAAFGKGDG